MISGNSKTGVAHQFLLCYLIGDEGSACPTSDLIIAGPDRSALLFLLSENIERKRTMQTASMRQNKFKNLKTPGNTAFGSVRPYAPISLLDNEHLFDYSIGKLSVRLRC